MIGYSRIRIWLHWIAVVLLLLQWLSADGLGRALEVIERQAAPTAWDFLLTNVHLFGGGLLLLLTLWRVRLRIGDAGPGLPGSQFLRYSGVLVHWALLGVLLLLPLSGALSYYQLSPSADWWHEMLGWILLGLIILHLLGVIWHSLRRTPIWRRMVTIGADPSESKSADSSAE